MTEKLLIFPQKIFVSSAVSLAHCGIVAPALTNKLKDQLITLFDKSGLVNPADRVWEGPFNASMNLLASIAYADAPGNWITTAFDSSINGSEELLRRLKHDLLAIQKHFFDGLELGTLISVTSGLSDSHHRGSSVSMLTFSSGKQLVYKPRDMGIEAWFFELAAWMQRTGSPFQVRAMRVLSRRGYGWMEFCAHIPCHDESQLRNFYRNAGAVLCLLHILLATDCHFENVIACGELPTIVDIETVLQPQLAGENDPPSPLRTGMLPRWSFGPAGQAYDLSALGCVSPRRTHLYIPAANENGFEFAPATLSPSTNVPFLRGHDVNPGLYIEEMEEGFLLTYRFLLSNRKELLAIVQEAAHEQIRFVPRDTLEYYQVLSTALLTENGEVYLRKFQPPRSILEPLRQDELSALRRLDIPRFTLEAGSRNLNGVIGAFPLSGVELARILIESLSEESCQRSAESIRASWSLYRIARSLES